MTAGDAALQISVNLSMSKTLGTKYILYPPCGYVGGRDSEEAMNDVLGATTVLAVAITKTVDFIRNRFDPAQESPKWVWNVWPLALGIVVALVWGVNAFRAVSITPAQEIFGRILSGVGMGAMGSAWHEVLDALSGAAKAMKGRPASAGAFVPERGGAAPTEPTQPLPSGRRGGRGV